jgi:hypothetical protein
MKMICADMRHNRHPVLLVCSNALSALELGHNRAPKDFAGTNDGIGSNFTIIDRIRY